LQSMHERLMNEGRLTPGAAAALQDSIASKQAALANPPAPVVFSDPSVTVQVHACDAHQVDPEFAAVTHQADCLSTGPCACARPSSIPGKPAGWVPGPPPSTKPPGTPGPPAGTPAAGHS